MDGSISIQASCTILSVDGKAIPTVAFMALRRFVNSGHFRGQFMLDGYFEMRRSNSIVWILGYFDIFYLIDLQGFFLHLTWVFQ